MPLAPTIPQASLPGGNANNNFSTVGGNVAGQKVLTTLYDLTPWNVMREVYLRHGMAPSFRQVLKGLGSTFTRGVEAPTTGHYEEDWDSSLVEIDTIVTPAGGAGQNMIVSLTAASMFDTAVTVGGAARKGSYPQENQRIQLPSGEMAIIVAKDVTTDPHRLTLRPVKATVNLNDHVTAGEKYFIPDNAWGEGTKLPSGRLKRIYKYTNTFQIIKGSFGASGTAMTTGFWPMIKEDGENIILVLEEQTMRDYERDSSGALIWGQQMDNITTTDTAMGYDVAVSGTEGLIPYALTHGYIDTYTPGSYTVQDFYVVTRIMEQERIGVKNLLALLGYDLYVEIEQALATLFAPTLAPQMIAGFVSQSDMVPGDSWQPNNDGDFVAWLGFQGVRLGGGYNILMRSMHEFNEAIGAGAEAYDYTKWGIFLPLGQTVDQKNRQPRSYFGYEWRQLGNYKREAVVATFAGVGVAGTGGYVPVTYAASEYDYMKGGIVSEIAFHAAAGNRIVIQMPA